jgi:tRNA A-37 threonylcarbamoyl transferase component Bud32/tetratricopeptide (TPR) repeat protein
MSSTGNEKVEEFFLELVDVPATARAARLSELCGGDTSLYDQVWRLLAADESASAAHDSGIVGGFASDPVPVRVGQYVINGVAGEGGMGAVYDALHEPTRRRAAVKLLRIATSTNLGRSRMRVEAETLGRLDSPNIARLYDAGVTEIEYADGRRGHHPFIAMEFVEGRSIVDFACQNKLTDRQRLALVQRVAEAVHHAHQRGVMHRDLKPRNVLVLADGTPKVVDFGIARLIDAAGDNVTQTGQLLGTLRYMSPEQTAGDHRNVDTRTDVYALGAIAFELLTDRPMISIDTGASLTDAMKILQTPPPRIAQLRPELAGDVDAIVHKATAFDVNDRYSSAQALADDLRAFLEGRDITARAPTALERFGRYVRRNKVPVAVAATLVALLVGGIFGTSWGLVRAQRARRSEVVQRLSAEKSATAAQSAEADSRAFSNFLVNRVLATARPADIQGGLGIDVKVIDAIQHAEEHLDADFAGRPGAEAIARQAIGATWRNRGEFVKAERQLRRADELAAQALGPASEVTLDIRNSLLVLLQQMDKNEEGIRLQEEIVKGFESIYGPRDPRTLSTKYNLAIYRAKSGDFATALKMLEQVHADRIAALGADDARTLSTIADIAELHLLLGDGAKAVEMQRELVETFGSKLGDASPQTVTSQYRLACLLQRINRVEEAIDLHEAVIPKLAKTVGERNATTLDAKLQLAKCYLTSTHSERAMPLIREYADGQSAQLGGSTIQTLRMFNGVTALLLRAKELTGAEELARRAVAHATGSNADTTEAFEATALLGQTLAAGGKPAEAEPLLSDAINKLQAAPSLDAPARQLLRSAMLALANIYERTNRPDQATQMRKKSEAIVASPAMSR